MFFSYFSCCFSFSLPFFFVCPFFFVYFFVLLFFIKYNSFLFFTGLKLARVLNKSQILTLGRPPSPSPSEHPDTKGVSAMRNLCKNFYRNTNLFIHFLCRSNVRTANWTPDVLLLCEIYAKTMRKLCEKSSS